ncbi:MAG: ATP-binding cassette domain-containing protein [Candidatus Heimdallarchaeota archaeon]|nr:ATP-binding cassette domain-containing protein [Candidatus Heimdallarchaeota archaeon]
MSYIEVEHLTFGYREGQKVLNDISLSLPLGEQVAIIGQNGSGKTTLAKLLIGLHKPWNGTIKVDGEDINKKAIAEIARKVGFIFQNPNQMLFTTSVQKELELSLRQSSLNREEKEEKIAWMLDFFNIERYKKTHPRLLSRGEKQKVALATVLVQDPKAIIFDEPFSGVDRQQRASVLHYVNQLKEQGKLIILITHDLEAIIESCERTVALTPDGSIAYDGSTLDVMADAQNFTALELGESPILNLLYHLQSYGLPKNILRRRDLVAYIKRRVLQ